MIFLGAGVFPLKVCAQTPPLPLLQTNPILPQLKWGNGAWGDFNGDSRPDLLMVGADSSGNPRCHLMQNIGNTLQENSSHPFPGLRHGDVAWVDLDGDGDDDVVMTGEDSSGVGKTLVFSNNAGSFQAVSGILLPGLNGGRLSHGDYDGDGDQDLFLGGFNKVGGYQGVIGENNGGFSFSVSTDSSYLCLDMPMVVSGDIDQDGKDDLVLAYASPLVSEGMKVLVLRSLGNMQFSPMNHLINPAYSGSLELVDDDNDGDLDLLVAGSGVSRQCEVYQYWYGQYQSRNVGIAGVGHGGATWADLDNDGFLDMVVCGYHDTNFSTRVFMGSSSGYQLGQGPQGLPRVYQCRLNTRDWNSDGHKDFFLMGEDSLGYPRSLIATWNTGSDELEF